MSYHSNVSAWFELRIPDKCNTLCQYTALATICLIRKVKGSMLSFIVSSPPNLNCYQLKVFPIIIQLMVRYNELALV